MTYDAHGQILTFENARNKTTGFTWTDGSLTKITDANGKETNLTYDARIRLDTITNALSEVTDIDYDLDNRVKKVTFPDSNYIEYTYDSAGRRTGFKDARGKTTTFGYDDNYRLETITDPLSHVTTYGYDLMSNLTTVTDANSKTTTYEYDDLNRLKKITYPAAAALATPLEESFEYDDAGNRTKHTDTAGRDTVYEYDAVNRLKKTTDALSAVTEFTYNERSQLTQVKDALNQEYDFTYDALGRQLTQTRNGTTLTFEYDAAGNRSKRTDHNGVGTYYTYDDLNRLINVAYDSGSGNYATYVYDDISRLSSAENQNGTVSFAYDDRGRVTSTTDVHGSVVEYTYDANGNRTQLKFNSNVQTEYAYDDAGRLTTLTDENSNDFNYSYDVLNRLTAMTRPNGITSFYSYDNLSRLTRLKHDKVSPAANLYDFQYSYNNASQISQIADGVQTRDFTYDDVDRLTGVTVSASPVETYGYDAVGNRTSSHLSATNTIGAFNILTDIDDNTFSYDSNGVRTGRLYSGAGLGDSLASTWDEENRLTTATISGGMRVNLDYRYDALGRRISRQDNLSTVNFTYDGMDVVMDDDGTTATTYQNGLGIDNKLKQNNGSDAYFLQDHLGSTVGLASSAGSITDANTYDSFGNASNSAFPTRYQFTGREFDSKTGLNYYRARWYDPKVGRFISEDPIGFRGGDVNLYGYVENNPVNHSDPLGLAPTPGYEQRCKTWLEKIINISTDIAKRYDDLALDKDKLPAHALGDKQSPRLSREGHYRIINELKAGRGLLQAWINSFCNDDDDGNGGPSPAPVPLPCKNKERNNNQPTLFELQLEMESHQYMEQFWGTIFWGSVIGGGVYLAPSAAVALLPYTSPVVNNAPAFSH
jgi:RHS repeat-associated protein